MGIERNPSLGLTINPYTNTIEPQSVTNTYRIDSLETFESVIAIPTGLDFYIPELSTSSSFDLINDTNGEVSQTLNISVLTELGGGVLPTPTNIQYYTSPNTVSILYVNSVHAGKLLRVTTKAVNNVITSEERNIQKMPVGTMIAVQNGHYVMSDRAYLKCGINGVIISANRFEFPDYYNWNVTMGFPYGKTGENPNTPFLKEHVLRGVHNDVPYLKNLGEIENKLTIPNVGYRHIFYREFPENKQLFIQGNESGTVRNWIFKENSFNGPGQLLYDIYSRPNFNQPIFQDPNMANKTNMSFQDMSQQYLAVQYYIKVD